MIPPVFGKTKIDCKTVNGHVESMGRNQLIGYLMERHNPPVKYTRKTISSHTQVVKKLLAADGNAGEFFDVFVEQLIERISCSCTYSKRSTNRVSQAF